MNTYIGDFLEEQKEILDALVDDWTFEKLDFYYAIREKESFPFATFEYMAMCMEDRMR